ncbi:MAG: hypothetical protein WCO19_05670, partial [Candidatus Saccharibacteria bacterium]
MIRYTSRWLTTTLLISVVLNLALGAILILRAPAPHPAHQSQLAQPATVAAKPAAPQAAPPAPRFHWSQIESEDFSVYVTNLRQIGCPEATIKEIVKSEIAEIYQEKRRGLEMAIQERKEHGTGKATFSALRKELDNLPRIESALVEEVMATQEQREAAKTLAAGPANVAAEEAAAKTALLKQTVRVPLA